MRDGEGGDGAVRAVIFDMDGVLVDSEPVHTEATRLLFAELGVSYVEEDDENFYGCTDREVFRQLRARYHLAPHEDQLAQSWIERVVQLLPGRLAPMHGVPEVPEGLRAAGLRLALASSSSPAIIRTTIDGLGLGDTFEATVSGRDVARGKPAPDIFLEAARRLGVEPAACVVVEDSYNGLCAARAAGIPCVVIPCPATSGQDFSAATVRLSSLHDLPAWIEARAVRG
jgi:HAD superfamily hydrolase (TIGR01509 family)